MSMTIQQARQRAKKLFGKRGHVDYKEKIGKHGTHYNVGYIDDSVLPLFFIEGDSNKSWEEAFEKAEQSDSRYNMLKHPRRDPNK